jgi:hypothetical protein
MHSHSVLHVAEEGGIWVDDAEYVALARRLQVRLVTTDDHGSWPQYRPTIQLLFPRTRSLAKGKLDRLEFAVTV